MKHLTFAQKLVIYQTDEMVNLALDWESNKLFIFQKWLWLTKHFKKEISDLVEISPIHYMEFLKLTLMIEESVDELKRMKAEKEMEISAIIGRPFVMGE